MVRSFADRNSLIETRIPADECKLLSFQSKVEVKYGNRYLSCPYFCRESQIPPASLSGACRAVVKQQTTPLLLVLN